MAAGERDDGIRVGRTAGAGGAAQASAPPPIAHSLLEERLYLLMVRCEGCGAGPLAHVAQQIERGLERTFDRIVLRCARCERIREFRFDVTGFFGRFYPRRGISDVTEPSHLLDRVAWVRWARLYLRAFGEGFKKGGAAARRTVERVDCGVLALRCLDEASKFFDRPGFDPGAEDLHSPGSAQALREAPDRYSRIEVLGLKLQIAMMLAAAGIDPEAPDARSGALEPVLPMPLRKDGPIAGGGAEHSSGAAGPAGLPLPRKPALPSPKLYEIGAPPAVKLLKAPAAAPGGEPSPVALSALEAVRKAGRLARVLAVIAIVASSLGVLTLAFALARSLR